MLPNILPVAEEHHLVIQRRTYGKRETRTKCPFCKEDQKPGKEKKFYLSLNTMDNVFRCWYCGISGGVLRFISLLDGAPEFKVRERYCKSSYQAHPVERLTKQQLHLLGYNKKPDWYLMRERSPEYYRRTRDLTWSDWQVFLLGQQRYGFQLLVIGIQKETYQKAVQRIREREKAIQWPLLENVLQLYSRAKRPKWTEEAEAIALHICDPSKYPFSPQKKENTRKGRS